jgi:hypothetical protein
LFGKSYVADIRVRNYFPPLGSYVVLLCNVHLKQEQKTYIYSKGNCGLIFTIIYFEPWDLDLPNTSVYRLGRSSIGGVPVSHSKPGSFC